MHLLGKQKSRAVDPDQGYGHWSHRWACYFKKVAERALNAKKIFCNSAKALALYKAFKAIAALKKKFKALQNVKTIAFEALLFCKSF